MEKSWNFVSPKKWEPCLCQFCLTSVVQKGQSSYSCQGINYCQCLEKLVSFFAEEYLGNI